MTIPKKFLMRTLEVVVSRLIQIGFKFSTNKKDLLSSNKGAVHFLYVLYIKSKEMMDMFQTACLKIRKYRKQLRYPQSTVLSFKLVTFSSVVEFVAKRSLKRLLGEDVALAKRFLRFPVTDRKAQVCFHHRTK